MNASSTYYADSEKGSDGNNGKASQAPWKTLERINSQGYLPGDRILLKRGCLWEGQLKPQGSGTREQPIRIGVHGEGPKPRIDGAGRSGLLDGAVVLLYNDSAHLNSTFFAHLDPSC